MNFDIYQSNSALEASIPAGPDEAGALLREAQAGMLDASSRQRLEMQPASLPSEFGQLLIVNTDGTLGPLVGSETLAEKAQRLAGEEREREAEESRRRAQEGERRAQEAQRRAQEAERKAADAQLRAREAQQLAAEALQHAEQAERRARRALVEMQGMAQSVAALMQLATKKQSAGH
jgi:hypothetical protein